MAGQGDFDMSSYFMRRRAERMYAGLTNIPFSWQHPLALSRSYSRMDLNEELEENVQRHFEDTVYNVSDQSFPLSHPQPLIQDPGPSTNACPQPPGYMDQPSPFALENTPTEISFMASFPKGNGILSFPNDDNEIKSISHVNINLIEERSPLLAMAFEDSRSGPQLYLEPLTPATALPFLRFLYTGSYALTANVDGTADIFEDVPTSVLFHCQLYRLGDIYELQDLKSQAYVNVLRQCEFGCSTPDKPIDLCGAVRYIYQYLSEHENLVDAIINYCVTCFLGHRLAEDKEFKEVAYELRPFHQDLCKNVMNREFENETAAAIIQMPFKPYIPETYASREDISTKRIDDVVYHFHASDDMESGPKKRQRLEISPKEEHKATLPFRPLEDSQWPLKDEPNTEEEEDYDLGSKRRTPSIAGPSISGISQLGKAQDEPAQPDTDAEYGFVPAPPQVLEASDSDSEPGDFVEVKKNGVNDALRALSIRTRDPTAGEVSSAQESQRGRITASWESDSESEWTLV